MSWKATMFNKESFRATHWLFRDNQHSDSIGKIIAWWEIRRIPYNILVGLVGVVSLAVNLELWENYVKLPTEIEGGPGPLVSVLVFGVLANIFYTSGWVFEAIYKAIRHHGSNILGRRLFICGLVFSLLLAALPGILMAIEAIPHVFKR